MAAGQVALLEREWGTHTEVMLRLPMRIAAQRRYNGSVAITRGPLVYALRIDERWQPIAPRASVEVEFSQPDWRSAAAFNIAYSPDT